MNEPIKKPKEEDKQPAGYDPHYQYSSPSSPGLRIFIASFDFSKNQFDHELIELQGKRSRGILRYIFDRYEKQEGYEIYECGYKNLDETIAWLAQNGKLPDTVHIEATLRGAPDFLAYKSPTDWFFIEAKEITDTIKTHQLFWAFKFRRPVKFVILTPLLLGVGYPNFDE